MRLHALLAVFAVLVLFCPQSATAGEPLVVKVGDGKFVPAAASKWEAAGEGKFRFVLKTGMKAADVAAEIKDKIAPFSVEASGDLILIFSGEGLTEQGLLEKLAGVELGADKAMGDALAALSALDSAGAPSMGDMSSASSIRASKSIDLPKPAGERRADPANLVGKVIGYEPCKPVPMYHIRVIEPPREGKHKDVFKRGDKIAVRGYYKVKDGSSEMDLEDPLTKINVESAGIKLGTKVFGKPFLKDGDEWVLETIEPK